MNLSSIFVVLIILHMFCINGTFCWFFKCFYNGVFYNTGDTIGQTYSPETDTCTVYKCISGMRITSMIIQNCEGSSRLSTAKQSPPTSPTTTPTTTVPTTPSGCFYDGQFYPSNTEISNGQEGNWCFFTFCDSNGQVIYGDDWNCGPSTPTTPRWTTEASAAQTRFLRILEQEIRALLKKA